MRLVNDYHPEGVLNLTSVIFPLTIRDQSRNGIVPHFPVFLPRSPAFSFLKQVLILKSLKSHS